MRRGTTPTLKFSLFNKDKTNFDTSLIENIRVTFAQKGVIVLEKFIAECEIADNAVSVSFTQEETLLFDAAALVEIQLKIKTNGATISHDPLRIPCGRILSEEIL